MAQLLNDSNIFYSWYIKHKVNYPKEVFWGQYSSLNQEYVYNEQEIHRQQLLMIEEKQKKVLQSMPASLKSFNSIFFGDNLYSAEQVANLAETQESQKIDEALQNILNNIQFGYLRQWGDKEKINNDKRQWTYINNTLEKLSVSLKQEIDKGQTDINKMIATQKMFDDVQRVMNTIATNKDDFFSPDLQSMIMSWIRLKGFVLEEIGTNLLNEKNQEYIAIQTGAVRIKGKEIIQDIMVFKRTDLSELITVSYPDRKKGVPVEITLKQFMENCQKQIPIQIEDKGQEALEKLIQMGIQAKAGIKQNLWNKKSLNTQITLTEIEVNNIFNLLTQLRSDDPDEKGTKTAFIKNKSPVYQAIINYNLYKVIEKIMHIDSGMKGNQLILGPTGFVPFSTRMNELLPNPTDILQIVETVGLDEGSILLNKKFMVKRSNYSY